MKLQFKHQSFQDEACAAVCAAFTGQPKQRAFTSNNPGANYPVVPELSDRQILHNINKIQRTHLIEPSPCLEGRFNLTVEMETGVGKTYTYIKTMYELNQRYGWCKFIVVVPSVAIREGVFKAFQITQEHFAQQYRQRLNFFLYSSNHLAEIDHFASDHSLYVMIINSQAFNARGKNARRIYLPLDEFRSRRPIDIIAQTNPIIIIDEPQSVEGTATKERLVEFNPLMTLRYSATHKKDSLYNLVYRLDAMDAYNLQLVKKISVKGISPSCHKATSGYIYLQSINLSLGNPTATIEFEQKKGASIRRVTRTVSEGFDLFASSGQLQEYQGGFAVSRIDGRDSSIEFSNGTRLGAGEAIGNLEDQMVRRLQIRETILSHLEREKQLFERGIKVLSLFFIDEVAKYKRYSSDGSVQPGEYAEMFEEEYSTLVSALIAHLSASSPYLAYLKSISPTSTHAGYFSIDKKSHRYTDSKVTDRQTGISDDADAYELIMKNKERLLDREEPVRFIFSHSALREGWDNPNVFQICTLKQSASELRKRQEVGRGLRLCVNQSGERMDSSVLGDQVHSLNILTVIANESYDSFAQGLQSELAEAVAYRPQQVTAKLFLRKTLVDTCGQELTVDNRLAHTIISALEKAAYLKDGWLLDSYYEDRIEHRLQLGDNLAPYQNSIAAILNTIYNPRVLQAHNARSNNVELTLQASAIKTQAFKHLWSLISPRSFYSVHFDSSLLIQGAITALDQKLHVTPLAFHVETGILSPIASKEELKQGKAWQKTQQLQLEPTSSTLQSGNRLIAESQDSILQSSPIKYDLVGEIVTATYLTRKAVVEILCGIKPETFRQLQISPEEFIMQASSLINEEKAQAILQHTSYELLPQSYSSDIFPLNAGKGSLGNNALATQKHLYDFALYKSPSELKFLQDLESSPRVALYVQLPPAFLISTPVGPFHPDWAIAMHCEQEASPERWQMFVIARRSPQALRSLTGREQAQLHCAQEHFRALQQTAKHSSSLDLSFGIADSYDSLIKLAD